MKKSFHFSSRFIIVHLNCILSKKIFERKKSNGFHSHQIVYNISKIFFWILKREFIEELAHLLNSIPKVITHETIYLSSLQSFYSFLFFLISVCEQTFLIFIRISDRFRVFIYSSWNQIYCYNIDLRNFIFYKWKLEMINFTASNYFKFSAQNRFASFSSYFSVHSHVSEIISPFPSFFLISTSYFTIYRQ